MDHFEDILILDVTLKRYDAGIEFIEMKEKDRARLKEFIDILQSI
jgi:hypothetical protein